MILLSAAPWPQQPVASVGDHPWTRPNSTIVWMWRNASRLPKQTSPSMHEDPKERETRRESARMRLGPPHPPPDLSYLLCRLPSVDAKAGSINCQQSLAHLPTLNGVARLFIQPTIQLPTPTPTPTATPQIVHQRPVTCQR